MPVGPLEPYAFVALRGSQHVSDLLRQVFYLGGSLNAQRAGDANFQFVAVADNGECPLVHVQLSPNHQVRIFVLGVFGKHSRGTGHT
jgi:hypothetical protein